ncbi:MAG TPA: FHA domain-containing protein [Planctomycetota bacterium]|nr:FHA domain-containing protein [Planctomycetota bacterium]
MVCVTYFEVKSPKRGAKLRLDTSFFVIGRGERIPIFHDDPSLSREHAAVVIRKTGVRVRDLGSKNGVLINGAPIGRYAEVDLKPGDSLRVGATTLVLREGEPPKVEPRAPEPEAKSKTEEVEVPPPTVPKTEESSDGEPPRPALDQKTLIEPPLEVVDDLSKLEESDIAPPVTSSSDSDSGDDEEGEMTRTLE